MTLQELINAAFAAIANGAATQDTPVTDNNLKPILSLVATTDDDGDAVVVVTSTPFELAD